MAICVADLGLVRELFPHREHRLEHCRGRFLPRFDARLVIRVDVHQRRVKADRTLIEGDQRADVNGVTSGRLTVIESRPLS